MIEIELIKNDLMSIELATLGHGFFLFSAPPFEKEFDYVKKAAPGKLTDTCWGVCRNGVPIDLPTEDDYFGIAVVDKDRKTIVHGYYTDLKIPAYEYVAWYTKEDVMMPDIDWNLICYVGYFRKEANILYQTDYREFTIKAGSVFPMWLLLLLLPLLFIKRKN